MIYAFKDIIFFEFYSQNLNLFIEKHKLVFVAVIYSSNF